jgi:hypothetical protein
MGTALHTGIAATAIADFRLYMAVYSVFIPWHALPILRTSLGRSDVQLRGQRRPHTGVGAEHRSSRGLGREVGLRSKDFVRRVRFAMSSSIIVAVIVLQTTAMNRPLCVWVISRLSLPAKVRYLCPPGLWPFIDYPMYAHCYYQGAQIDRVRFIGISADSRELHLTPEELGFSRLLPVKKMDWQQIIQRVESYSAARRWRLVRLRAEDHPLILSRDGIRRGMSRVLFEADIRGSK